MQRDERKVPEEVHTGHMRLHQDAVTRYLKKHPQDDLVLVLTRNKNANCVCYVVRRDGTGAAQPKKPLHMYWLDIDPSYQKAARPLARAAFKPSPVSNLPWTVLPQARRVCVPL